MGIDRMVLSQIDMPPILSVSIGCLLLFSCIWYWQRLGRADVEPSRRAIRRASLVLAALAVFALVRAASFVDSEIHPGNYVTSWLAAFGLIFLFILLVAVDLVNSLLIYRRMLLQEAITAAQDLQFKINEEKGASVKHAANEDLQDE